MKIKNVPDWLNMVYIKWVSSINRLGPTGLDNPEHIRCLLNAGTLVCWYKHCKVHELNNTAHFVYVWNNTLLLRRYTRYHAERQRGVMIVYIAEGWQCIICHTYRVKPIVFIAKNNQNLPKWCGMVLISPLERDMNNGLARRASLQQGLYMWDIRLLHT